MSTVVPKKPLERIQFYENHIAPWTAATTAIGLTTGAVTVMEAKTVAARDAFNAHEAAQQAAKVATEAYLNAVEDMTVEGAGLLKTIRGKADTTRDPNVYTLAAIPAPATPTPKGAPGVPYDFKFAIEQATGALTMTWKNKDATASVYLIYRRLAATGPWSDQGGVGKKEFVDTTIPAGTGQVQYKVRAVRSTGVSEWVQVVINLGNDELPSITESTVKLAA